VINSYEAGILENPNTPARSDMYLMTVNPESAPNETETISVTFKNGHAVFVTNKDDGTVVSGALDLYLYLNKVA